MGKTGKKGGKRLKKKRTGENVNGTFFKIIPPRFTTLNVYSET